LIDFTLSNESQVLFAKSYLRPVRQVTVDPGIAAKMAPGQRLRKSSCAGLRANARCARAIQ
jgi:hypothetical protein